jgi:hypothetical protein
MVARVLILLTLLASALAAEPLRVEETRHYRVHSDVDPAFHRELCERLDAMYDEYTRRLAVFGAVENSPRLDVYIFDRRDDYARLTGNRYPNTGGVFMPAKNLLAVFVEGQGRDAARKTLQHEAFHQFAHSAIGRNLPVWLNEGLAQVFEEGIWTGRGFSLGHVPPRRLRQLRADLEDARLTPFRDFLSMSDQQWHDGFTDAGKVATQYNQAWAMVHFLIYASDDAGQPRFRPRFTQMLTLISQGTAPAAAWEQAFGKNHDGFEKRFREWAFTLEPTREATYIELQNVLADLLVQLSAKEVRFEAVADFRDHVARTKPRLHYARGTLRWSTDRDPTVYFRASGGGWWSNEQLRFEPRTGAPLPDLVFRPLDGLSLRARFRYERGEIEHETLVEQR